MIRTLSHPPDVPGTAAPLAQWLSWLETIHPVAIDMGLDRVSRVADRLQLRPVDCPVVLVGGTNGKGSTVAMLSAIYGAAGYRVGAYTSPHIDDFRERIRINGEMASARDVVDALAFVEAGRPPETLTYFEYTTLAAMQIFRQAQCDVCLLEVGLGGRLDATNLWDADCAVVTSIALDHEEFLGSDISVIATEKAAIGRTGRTLVVGEPDPPASLSSFANREGIRLEQVGDLPSSALPLTNLQGEHQRRNAACAAAVVTQLDERLPVSAETLRTALLKVGIPARFEQGHCDGVSVVMDVAHNPAGAEALCRTWQQVFAGQRAEVVFAALADKDLAGIVAALEPVVAHWHCVQLDVARAMPLEQLAQSVQEASEHPLSQHASVADAWQTASAAARKNGTAVLVAGSFHTIASVHEVLDPDQVSGRE
ncbi:bifunctional folylpolyglutamate synthase/dihydrofolate synthase [Granulosicoccus sp. 3-233]|uniref:bifunctional folylpolyglutamate synthase/dihydrofolate synthase n=1 Tax=Granulosicoccus sp. 3-233 TaxID=3417969 RepID=UPI003D3565DB